MTTRAAAPGGAVKVHFKSKPMQRADDAMRNEDADEATFRRYAVTQEKLNMTLPEAEQLSRYLAAKLKRAPGKIDLAVGLANGAILPTQIVAETLGVPFHMVKVRRQGSRWIQRMQGIKRALSLPSGLLTWGPFGLFWYWFQRRFNKLEKSENSFEFEVAGKHVALIDDCIVSGGSIRYVQDRLLDSGAAGVHVGVICWSDDEKAIDRTKNVVPDVYLHRAVHFYPWSSSSPHLAAFEDWLRARKLELWK
jgi:adenine/guanine phosphoribosyltransferase-like PRPP-binding protein